METPCFVKTVGRNALWCIWKPSSPQTGKNPNKRGKVAVCDLWCVWRGHWITHLRWGSVSLPHRWNVSFSVRNMLRLLRAPVSYWIGAALNNAALHYPFWYASSMALRYWVWPSSSFRNLASISAYSSTFALSSAFKEEYVLIKLSASFDSFFLRSCICRWYGLLVMRLI